MSKYKTGSLVFYAAYKTHFIILDESSFYLNNGYNVYNIETGEYNHYSNGDFKEMFRMKHFVLLVE